MTFSKKYGYTQGVEEEEILEDAPQSMRIYYIERILTSLIHIDRDLRYPNKFNTPLGTKDLIEDLCATIGAVPDSEYTDSWFCNNILKKMINDDEWYFFYDYVERIGKLLKISEKKHVGEDVWLKKFGIKNYVADVNEMLERFNVGWRLYANGEVYKNTPRIILEQEEGVKVKLSNKYEPAKRHYEKAVRFIRHIPLDAENSIKEIISAVESVARIQYPNAKTLGDAIKHMKKAQVPPLLLAIIEKFYAFANAEPGIRHGGPDKSNIALDEAELCLQFGTAIIRYLLSDSGDWTDVT